MRDPKSFFLLIGVLVLVTLSFVLISIWGYHYYFRNADTQSATVHPEKTSMPIEKPVRGDSLQLVLDSIIHQYRNQQDSAVNNSTDSISKILELKILQFNKLKKEIIEILKEKPTPKDMPVADERISLLQQSVNELRERNDGMREENERLNEMVKQLIAANTNNGTKKAAPKSINSLPLLVSHLKFTAMSKDGAYQKITAIASQTEYFTGSFELNIKSVKNNPSEIYVVILQPNGKVLLNSSDKPGTFQADDGKKTYSAVLHFNALKDNHKRLQFSVGSHSFQKGKYTMQIYHNGILIGRLNRVLT